MTTGGKTTPVRAAAGQTAKHHVTRQHHQDAGRSDRPDLTSTRPDRAPDRPDNSTTGQYITEMGGNWLDSGVTSNFSAIRQARQGCGGGSGLTKFVTMVQNGT